jgi:dTDP-4-amino-4,6-dideoxygalactose transaminase
VRARVGQATPRVSATAPDLPASIEPVPVLRPRLPPAERLLPYLKRIDATRTYSNWGPLSAELERRLAESLRLPAGGVVSASSGTAALVGAILAAAGRATSERPVALVPAFTFVATAVAVEQCGYCPFLADIDAKSWMLDPERLAGHHALDQVGLAVPVAPFGRPVAQAPWQRFREKTGVPVVIDGAGAFDRFLETPDSALGQIPVAISFHATKCFATGEGGCVASGDGGLALRVGRALNFGFHDVHDSRGPSINGKMSEYHAAVGLAELDGWSNKQRSLRVVASRYRAGLSEAGLSDRLLAAPDVGASYLLFHCHDEAEAGRVEEALSRYRVESRRWYGAGLHHQAHFSRLQREHLEVTDALAPCVLALPLAPDLTGADVARVVEALARGVGPLGEAT